MYPIRMNKSTIGFRQLTTKIEDMDEVFREPSSAAGKTYGEEIIIDDIAQIRNYTIQAYGYADLDNVELKSKVRLIFAYDDFMHLNDVLRMKLKKGDLVTFLGVEDSNLIVSEIIPKSYLQGKPLLYYVELKDNTRPIGGIK